MYNLFVFSRDHTITKLKTFINTTLGETFADASDADRVEAVTLYNRREHYNPKGFNKRGLTLTAGYDMQDDRVEGSIYAFASNNEAYLIEHFILRGDPSQPEVQETIALIESKVLPSDKFLGTLAANWGKAAACFEKGYQWMVLMQDGVAIKNAGDAAVSSFRDVYK